MKFYFATYLALTSALTAVASPSFAQSQPQASDEAEEQGAGEILITAQRREQSLADVPVSVSVVSGETLAQNGLSSLADVAARLPSVKVGFAPGASVINIRGVSSGNNPGFEQSVGTFVDGVYRGRSRALGAGLFDIERIEVLKGPQPTFFGNNVVGGALNITTRKPEFETSLNATGLYSPSDGQYISEVGITAPLGDKVAVRLAGKLYGMKGWQENVATNKKLPRNRDFIGRASILFKPSDMFTSNLRFDYGRNRDNGPAAEILGCPAPAGFPATTPTNPCGRAIARATAAGTTFNSVLDGVGYQERAGFDYDFTEVAWTNELELGNVTLSSITSYFDHSAASFTPGALPGTVIPGTASTTFVTLYEDTNQFTQELRATSDTGGMFEYMFGGYYAREDMNTDTFLGLFFGPQFGVIAGAPFGPTTPVVQSHRQKQKTDTYSAFGSLSIKPVENLTLDLGLRYTSVHKNARRASVYGSMNTAIGGGRTTRENFVEGPASVQTRLLAALGAPGYATPTRTDNELTPSVKLSYKLGDAMVYASWAKGFKAGGFSQSSAFIFEPETANSYEAGIKASLLDRRLFVTATYFRGDYKNLQEGAVIIVGGLSQAIVTNAAKSRSQGFEFSADAKLSDVIRLRTDVTRLNSKYVDFTTAPCITAVTATLPPNAACQLNATGLQRNFAAKWSGNVGATVTLPVGESLKLTFDPSLSFTSSFNPSFNLADPLYRQDGYSKIDARVGIGADDGSWDFSVIGKNLTNKRTYSFAVAIAGSPGSTQVFTDPERSVAFQFTAKF